MDMDLKTTKKLPSFFILGAARCGTSSLYQYLKQHPNIYMSPVKEPCFFCETFQVIKNPVEYARLFEASQNQAQIGEASHVYLTNPASAGTLRNFFPKAKFVLILRHPADRAYSLYHQMRRWGYETITSFEKALETEERRFYSKWFHRHCNQYIYNFFYFRSGLFGDQIERYFRLFDRTQFYIITLSQLKEAPLSTIQGIYAFLGVEKEFKPEIKVFNKGQTSRWPLLQNFLNLRVRQPRRLRRLALSFAEKYNLTQIPPMNPETRRLLCSRYQPDLKKLYHLTRITFSE